MGCECTTDATCAMGAPTCIDAVCASGSCFFRTHDERCMSGQTCDVVIGCVGGGVDANAGDAPMTSDAGSDTGSLDAYAIDLGQPDTGARSPLGGRCRTGGDCAPIGGMIAMCMTMDTTTGITFNGGYCTTTCSVLGGTRSCPSGGVCVDPSGTLTDGFCAVACSGGVQCRISEGYGCRRPRMGTGGTTLACLPPGL